MSNNYLTKEQILILAYKLGVFNILINSIFSIDINIQNKNISNLDNQSDGTNHYINSAKLIQTEEDIIHSHQYIEDCILPTWLDKYIFESLGAKYQPSYNRFSYNLDLNNDESKIYLGTYFPRSFAEGLLVFDSILQDNIILSIFENKSVLKILDFGCGSGGEIFGFLQAIENRINKKINISITCVDGNHHSLRILEKITKQYNTRKKTM